MSEVLFVPSPQKKASFQQEITLGHLSQTHQRELEAKLSETERKIMSAKQQQERYQGLIDWYKQQLQDTSQEQDKGRTHVCWHQSYPKDMYKIVLLIIVISLIVFYH